MLLALAVAAPVLSLAAPAGAIILIGGGSDSFSGVGTTRAGATLAINAYEDPDLRSFASWLPVGARLPVALNLSCLAVDVFPPIPGQPDTGGVV